MDHLRKRAGHATQRVNEVLAAATPNFQGLAHLCTELNNDNNYEQVMWVEVNLCCNFKNDVENIENDIYTDDRLVTEAIRRADFTQLARDLPHSEARAAPGNPALS